MLDVRIRHKVHSGLQLDLALELGAECGIVFGPSGAGKTTLLRLIAGLVKPDAGRVRLGETALYDSESRIEVPLRHRRLGMIFQDDLLFPHLDVAGNVRFGLRKGTPDQTDSRVAEVAELCGIADLLGRGTGTLSGGERQRVGLARALAPRPRLLLCDEPVSALDLEARFALVGRLRAIQRAERIPVLYVTHSPAEAIALGDRLYLLREGRIAAAGAPLDVLAAAGRGPGALEGVRNVFPAAVVRDGPGIGETRVAIAGGPELVIPHQARPIGSRLMVAVRADEILLARGPVEGLSARNQIAGQVERIVPHEGEAEVIIRTGAVAWIVSVVASAVAALELQAGGGIHMIVKARSCQILHRDGSGP